MSILDDSGTIPFGEEDKTSSEQLPHPYVTFFHLFFKGCSVITYMLCGWFSDSFIASFVTIVLLLSMDFWTVKNITGRLMVGLRWWNYVDDDGQSHWVFESKQGQQNRVNNREARIFWVSLILTPLIWSVFLIIAVFGLKLKWLLLVLIALVLNGSNLYGYFKCKVGSTGSLTSVTSSFFQQQLLKNAMSMVTKQATTPSGDNMNPSNII